MSDVLVEAPVARLGLAAVAPLGEPPSPEDMCRILTAENKQLRRDLRELGDTASMIASVALCLARIAFDAGLEQHGTDTVRIPAWLHQRMVGASVQLGREVNGDITVRIRDEGAERVVPEP